MEVGERKEEGRMMGGRRIEEGRMVVGGRRTGERRMVEAAKAPQTATLSSNWLGEGEAAGGTQQRDIPPGEGKNFSLNFDESGL